MFICGDDSGAKTIAAKLASDLNFDVVDASPLVDSRWLEGLAMLWIHLAYQQGFRSNSPRL
jgi:8-hydroxy-5-deazaflavin:NADPH oxidoreductase